MPDLLGTVRRAFLCSGFLLAALLAGGRAYAEDSFLLALTWHPGFCADRAGAAECRLAPKDRQHLVLHGLWPQWDVNGDGRRGDGDDFCISGAFNRKNIIRLDDGDWLMLPPVGLEVISSAALEQAMPGTVVGLDRHEWWKHGTCSGLTAEEYFAASTARLRELERSFLARLLTLKAGATVKRQRLFDAFEADFGRGSARALILDCTKDGGVSALMEIRIRLKRSGVSQGLTADSLAVPAKPPRGDCGSDIFVPGWPR